GLIAQPLVGTSASSLGGSACVGQHRVDPACWGGARTIEAEAVSQLFGILGKAVRADLSQLVCLAQDAEQLQLSFGLDRPSPAPTGGPHPGLADPRCTQPGTGRNSIQRPDHQALQVRATKPPPSPSSDDGREDVDFVPPPSVLQATASTKGQWAPHTAAEVNIKIAGRHYRATVDCGASDIVLSPRVARALGRNPDDFHTGTIHCAQQTLCDRHAVYHDLPIRLGLALLKG
ncbi:hypothetical protein EV182_007182, partial [Spiromyces aspiralis]